MSWFNELFSSLRIWNKGHDYVVPVISSVGNGAKGDKGDPFEYSSLTEDQVNDFSRRIAEEHSLQDSVANIISDDNLFKADISGTVKADLATDTTFVSNVASQQSLQDHVSESVISDTGFVEDTTQMLLDDSDFSTAISDSILRIVSNIETGVVNVSGSSSSIVTRIAIPASCNYTAGDNVLVFVSGLLETRYSLDQQNATIVLSDGISHAAEVQILVFKLSV